jgi:protein SCO1
VTRRYLAALLALVAVLGLAACSSSGTPKQGGASGSDLQQVGTGTFRGAEVEPPQPRPQFTLTDTAGKTYAFGTQTAKHPTMLYFGYTQCPDICPETMADVRLALLQVPAAVAARTRVVFVTTDVQHDTAPVLAKWLSNFSAGSKAQWIGLRGTQTEIDAAQAAAHITVAEDGGKTHSAQVLLYGPDDYAHVTFVESTTEQQQIAHDLPLVAAGKTGRG